MLWDLFKPEAANNRKGLVEWIQPQKTFDDVILPARTRKQLRDALTQIDKHNLIFEQWGLGHRHTTGLGLGFNFAGPPGTGKSLCAEALANALNRPLCRVKYSQLESMWAGESGKNVSAVFREAKQANAVLFFDEADAVASRRLTNMAGGYEREANQVINILLKELEEYDGVVIFATNLATNFDPAFERRIRTHIYFETPGSEERYQIWHVQLSKRTPLADDVDFHELADRFEMSGGDIKNAVLKAAQMAAGEEGADSDKRIHQRHFMTAAEEVLDARRIMQQTIFEDENGGLPDLYNAAMFQGRLDTFEAALQNTHTDTAELRDSVDNLYNAAKSMDEAFTNQLTTLNESWMQRWNTLNESSNQRWTALNDTWMEKWTALETRLRRGTFVPLPAWALALGGIVLLILGGVFAKVVLR